MSDGVTEAQEDAIAIGLATREECVRANAEADRDEPAWRFSNDAVLDVARALGYLHNASEATVRALDALRPHVQAMLTEAREAGWREAMAEDRDECSCAAWSDDPEVPQAQTYP